MKGIVTGAMVEAVREGTHELELCVRPRCRRRVRLMRDNPIIGPYADALTDEVGGVQLTGGPEVAEWLRQHPFCGIAAELVPVCDEVPF